MSTLNAGVSRRTITPPKGIYLMGYGNRIQGNLGVHDDLDVTTLVLDDGITRAALITVDMAFLHSSVVAQVKARAQEACSLAPDGVFVCCSHTHAGPVAYADEQSDYESRYFIEALIDQLVESAVRATANLQTVTLNAGRDEAHININRRERRPDGTIIIGQNPNGAVDHSVQVVQVFTKTGGLLATLVNYACHPVVMGPQNRYASADWVGAMRRYVEAETGALCLFIQGATGNVNPRKMRWTDDNWDEVEEQGREVGAAVLRAGDKATSLKLGSIHARQDVQWLRLMPSGKRDLRAFVPHAKTLEEALAIAHKEFPWKAELQTRSDGVYSPLYIGALQIGDWALAALGTEPFAETGLAIKAGSSAKMTFVAGYANGCNSYLPVESAYADGGYEVETAPLYYRLPAGFTPGSAEAVTQAVLEFLKS
jgi:hypothetical protein